MDDMLSVFTNFKNILCVCPECNNISRLSQLYIYSEQKTQQTWLDDYDDRVRAFNELESEHDSKANEIREKLQQHKTNIAQYEREFEKSLRFFEEIGCDLKSIEPGLVDFYSKRESELIYLCWKEDEDKIQYWHSLSSGFQGRQPLS